MRLLIAVCLVGFVCCGPVAAQNETEMNFVDVKLDTFVKWVSSKCDKQFIHGPDLRDRSVFLLSPGKVPLAQVWPVFLSVMAHNGYGVLRATGKSAAKRYRIIDSGNIKWQALPVYESLEALPKLTLPVRCILTLRHASPRFVNNALRIARVLDPRAGSVVGLEPNAIIIAGFAPNVRQVARLVQLIDAAAGKDLPRRCRVRVLAMPDKALQASRQTAQQWLTAELPEGVRQLGTLAAKLILDAPMTYKSAKLTIRLTPKVIAQDVCQLDYSIAVDGVELSGRLALQSGKPQSLEFSVPGSAGKRVVWIGVASQ